MINSCGAFSVFASRSANSRRTDISMSCSSWRRMSVINAFSRSVSNSWLSKNRSLTAFTSDLRPAMVLSRASW